jgi:hypothetical protein
MRNHEEGALALQGADSYKAFSTSSHLSYASARRPYYHD